MLIQNEYSCILSILVNNIEEVTEYVLEEIYIKIARISTGLIKNKTNMKFMPQQVAQYLSFIKMEEYL